MPDASMDWRMRNRPRRKVRRVRNFTPSPEAGTRGKSVSQRRQTSPRRYRQIMRQRPQVAPTYSISHGRHPEKFVGSGDNRRGGGQVVDMRGSVTKERNIQRFRQEAQRRAVGLSLLNLLGSHPVGRGLASAQAAIDFNKVRPLLAKSAKSPTIHFQEGLLRKGAAGYVGGGLPKGHIALDASYAGGMIPGLRALVRDRASGEGVLLHELGHQSQPRAMFNPGGGEGKYTDAGAELFRVLASSRIGKRPYPIFGEYAKQSGEFLRRYGRRGVVDQLKGSGKRY